MSPFQEVMGALEGNAAAAFGGISADLEKQVFPALAAIAKAIVAIGEDLAAGEISENRAGIELQMAQNAAEAWIVGFVEATLERVQQAVNAVLTAAAAVINRVIGFAVI